MSELDKLLRFRNSVANYLTYGYLDDDLYHNDPIYHALVYEDQKIDITIDVPHIQRQIEFSRKTFGPGPRTAGVIDHIQKELKELEENPFGDEWKDIIILAIDVAWRAGYTPAEIISAVKSKQLINESREWPDWQTAEYGKAIEHVRA